MAVQAPTALPTRTTACLRTLELLAFGPVTAPQAARHRRGHPRTARRILARMVGEGWVRQLDGSRVSRRYELTLRSHRDGSAGVAGSEMRQAAIPLIERAAAITSLPAYLAIPCYRDVLPRLQRRIARPARDLLPATESAAGQLLLAYREPWRNAVLKDSTQRTNSGQYLPACETTATHKDRQLALPVSWREDGVIGALVLVGVKSSDIATTVVRMRPLLGQFA